MPSIRIGCDGWNVAAFWGNALEIKKKTNIFRFQIQMHFFENCWYIWVSSQLAHRRLNHQTNVKKTDIFEKSQFPFTSIIKLLIWKKVWGWIFWRRKRKGWLSKIVRVAYHNLFHKIAFWNCCFKRHCTAKVNLEKKFLPFQFVNLG